MSDKKHDSRNNNILFQEVLILVEGLIMAKTGKQLSNIDVLVLRGSWKGHKYSQIAANGGYTDEYLKNDIGPKLWKRLSQALGKKVTKNNFKAILEQHIYQENSTRTVNKLAVKENIYTNQFPETPQPLYHNLPSRDYTRLVGREAEAKRLLELLSFEWSTPCVSIEGIGGAGKTTLALDIAYRCLKASNDIYLGRSSVNNLPNFELIVFTSAKADFFTPKGILPRLRRERTLVDIFISIIRTISFYDSKTASFEETYEQIYKCLANMRTLLIIDNLDNLDTLEQQQVLSFLYELPPTVKALITSREKTPFSTVALSSLTQTEALILIQQHAAEKQVDLLNLKQCVQLYQTTGGIPAAIIYAVSQLAAGYSFENVNLRLIPNQGDFCRFYFDSSVKPFKGQPAHKFLMALSLFAKPALPEALRAVAGVENSSDAADGLAKLQQLSLINYRQKRYRMLPLTREYALSEMSFNPADFENSARDRWVTWYLDFAQQHGRKDWREWQDYQYLEEEWDNLTEVIEWCITNNLYHDVCKFWHYIKCYTYSLAYRQNRLSYWDAPLLWLEWLSEAAVSRNDFQTAAEIIGDRAWKLTLIGQEIHLAVADGLFNQAWQLHQYLTLDMQVDLAIHIGVWHIQKQQFSQATDWLNQARKLLENSDMQIDSYIKTRLYLHIFYYQGEIFYKTENYQGSKILFKQIFEQSQSIGWQRASLLAKEFLADIAIKEGKLNQAQNYLAEVLQVAEDNQDKCSRAYTKRSLARLEKKLGNGTKAKRWINEAVKDFETLGMKPEAREAYSLLQGIQS